MASGMKNTNVVIVSCKGLLNMFMDDYKCFERN